jgi:hypothetical protein
MTTELKTLIRQRRNEVLSQATQSPAQGAMVFYEGNEGREEPIFVYYGWQRVSQRVPENDEARSLKLFEVREGTEIFLWDSPQGSFTDDWCRIIVKKTTPVEGYLIGSFERSIDDEYIHLKYEPDNGLDGKVSRIEIIPFWAFAP